MLSFYPHFQENSVFSGVQGGTGPMDLNTAVDPRDPAFLRLIKETKEQAGRVLLTDDNLLVLACEEISRTFTREEKHYTD
jgi:hypothetical protein